LRLLPPIAAIVVIVDRIEAANLCLSQFATSYNLLHRNAYLRWRLRFMKGVVAQDGKDLVALFVLVAHAPNSTRPRPSPATSLSPQLVSDETPIRNICVSSAFHPCIRGLFLPTPSPRPLRLCVSLGLLSCPSWFPSGPPPLRVKNRPSQLDQTCPFLPTQKIIFLPSDPLPPLHLAPPTIVA
jgi:hypothetical protein